VTAVPSAGFEGPPVMVVVVVLTNPPKPSLGVRSQILLSFGVMPPLFCSLLLIIPVVDFGDGWPRVDRELERIKSVRLEWIGS